MERNEAENKRREQKGINYVCVLHTLRRHGRHTLQSFLITVGHRRSVQLLKVL